MKVILNDGYLNKVAEIKSSEEDSQSYYYYDVAMVVHEGQYSKMIGDTFCTNYPITDYNDGELAITVDNIGYSVYSAKNYMEKLVTLLNNNEGENGVAEVRWNDNYNCKVLIDYTGAHWDYLDWMDLTLSYKKQKTGENFPVSKKEKAITMENKNVVESYETIPEGSHLYVIRIGNNMYLTDYTEASNGSLMSAEFKRNPKTLPIFYLTDDKVDDFANQVGGIAIKLDVGKNNDRN